MSQRAFPDLGLLVLRVGLGIRSMVSWLAQAGRRRRHLDQTRGHDGDVQHHVRAGSLGLFAAAAAEFVGGILLALGVIYRPTVVSPAFTMCVAMSWHIAKGDPFSSFGHSG